MSDRYEHYDKLAQGKLSQYKNFEDVTYYGPGEWLIIHEDSLENDENAAKSIIKRIKKLRCDVCKKHASEYLKTNPIEPYIGKMIVHEGVSRPIGLFVWTWLFHNAVNTRLGKPTMRLTDALMAIQTGSCATECSNSK